MHWIPHVVPLQVALPLTTEGQGVQEVPHEVVAVFEEHVPLQSWKPVLQARLQLPPLQEAVALGFAAQAMHAAPHAVGSVSDLQAAPQAWNFVSQDVTHVPALQVTDPFAGSAQSIAVRQPSLHVRFAVSQKRPLLHWSWLVQPALQVLVARSQ